MKRNVSLEEITDGKLYTENDMAKLGCDECSGCSQCCRGMGKSIILDPYDGFLLQKGTGKAFQELLAKEVELSVVDGVILPNLSMQEGQEACSFLNDAGRCSIHAYRPGICRLFPLGRYYENGDYTYILQVHECAKGNRSKVKISKWIQTPDGKENHEFHVKWHYFLNRMEELVASVEDEEMCKQLNMVVLNMFYLSPYDLEAEFYPQFLARMERMEAFLQEIS